MRRRVITSAVAASFPLAAVSMVWLGAASDARPGYGGYAEGRALAAAEEPAPCVSSEDVGEVCESGNAEDADGNGADRTDGRESGTTRGESPQQPADQRSAADDPDPTQAPSPPDAPPGEDRDGDDADESGNTKRLRYEYGVDRKSWYWDGQRDEEVAAGPVAQRTRLPNPQRPDTLPVAVESGEPSKLSAISFNLVGHDIPAGSEVTRFVMTVAEGTEPGEVPTANPQNRRLQACTAGSFWPSGQAETWDTRPDVTDECVTGIRRGDDTEAAWVFDLSAMAASWGEDPFSNNGVILTGVIPQDAGTGETWQVNLKAPSRDDPVTPVNEYEQTSDRLTAEVAYVPGTTGQGPAPPLSISGSSSASGSSSSGTSGGTGLGTTGLSGGTSGAAGPPGANGDAPDPQLPTVAATPPFVPKVPPYVWALIPAALLATAAVRSALVEKTAITRPGGVIETIRNRNAARLGTPHTEPGGPLARLVTLLPFKQAGR